MIRIGTLGALALIFASGCPYVGKGTYDDKLATIDEDVDGSTFLVDCDDVDADRMKLADFEELDDPSAWAYDGKDNDCDEQQQDLVDVDGDGFPGISFADWEAVQAEPSPRTNAANNWQVGVLKEFTMPSGDVVSAFDCDDDPSDDVEGLPGARDINLAAADVPYDGIDANCAANTGANGLDQDFDNDSDGFVASAHEAAYEAAGGTLPGGDCDDTNPDANPGMDEADDIFYDGVDTDCAGNNDFDVDADDFMPDVYGTASKALLIAELGLDADLADELTRLSQAQWQSRFRDYEAKYAYDFPDDFGDCRDILAPAYASGTTPDEINPAMTEVWYDGVDGNCDGDNDFDNDADGYMPDGALDGGTFGGRNFTEYEAEWDYALSAELYDDCDDASDEVHPGVLERLGDTVDQDCDGDNHTGLLRTAAYTWTEPRDVVVGATGFTYVLVTAADENVRGTSKSTDQGLALIYDLSPAEGDPAYFDAESDPTDVIVWNGSSSAAYPQGNGVDAYFTNEAFYATTTYLKSTQMFHVVREVAWDATLDLYKSPSLAYDAWDDGSADMHTDTDLRVDPDGFYWSVSCGNDVVQFVVAKSCTSGTKTTWSRRGSYSTLELSASLGLSGVDSCFVVPPAAGSRTATATVCSATGSCSGISMTRADVSAATTCTNAGEVLSATTTTYSGVANVDSHGDWLVLPSSSKGLKISSNTGTTSYSVLSTYNVYDADVVMHNTRMYLAAVVNDQNGDGKKDLLFAYSAAGAPTSLTTTVVPMSDEVTTWAASNVGLHVDDDRIMVGVSSANADDRADDMVGWFFMKAL